MPQTLPVVTPLAVLVLMGLLSLVVATWIGVVLRFAFGLPVLPPRTMRLVPWGAGSVLAALLVWYATTNLVSLAYFLTIPGKLARARAMGSASPVDQMIASALSNAAVLVLVPLTLAATAGARRRDFGLVGPGLGRQAIRGVLGYPLLAPCVFGVMLICVRIWDRTAHPLEDAIKLNHSPGMAALMVLAGVILAPAAEELVFRGILLGWLTRVALATPAPAPRPRPRPAGFAADSLAEPPLDLILHDPEASALTETDLGPYLPSISQGDSTMILRKSDLPGEVDPSGRLTSLLLANVIVSIVFAALHGAVWPTPIPIFFLSLGLGLLYQRTGGLVAPFALHLTFNGISTLIMLLTVGATSPKTPKAPVPVPAPAEVAARWVRSGENGERIHKPIDAPESDRYTHGPAKMDDLGIEWMPVTASPSGQQLDFAASSADIRGTRSRGFASPATAPVKSDGLTSDRPR